MPLLIFSENFIQINLLSYFANRKKTERNACHKLHEPPSPSNQIIKLKLLCYSIYIRTEDHVIWFFYFK